MRGNHYICGTYSHLIVQYLVHPGAGKPLHMWYLRTFGSTVVHPGAGKSLYMRYLLAFDNTAVHPGVGKLITDTVPTHLTWGEPQTSFS